MFYTLDMDNVLNSLVKLGNEIDDSTTFINDGGCCVFAALVGKQLQKYLPVRIRSCYSHYADANGKTSINKIRNKIKKNRTLEWESNGIYFDHVIIEFRYKGKSYFYDASGISEASDQEHTFGLRVHKGFFSVSDALKFAKENTWNHLFDRSQIPEIKEMVDNFFKGFKLLPKRRKIRKEAKAC